MCIFEMAPGVAKWVVYFFIDCYGAKIVINWLNSEKKPMLLTITLWLTALIDMAIKEA